MFNKKITTDNETLLFKEMALKNINFALISLDFIMKTQNVDYNLYMDDHVWRRELMKNLQNLR